MDVQVDLSTCTLSFCEEKRKCISLWRWSVIAKQQEQQINEEIRDKELRVIGPDGEQLGILPLREAQDLAVEKNLDLVKISPGANPPVVKIMDYGKYRFEQQKREKEAKKNQKIVELKEIRLSVNIDTHDFETKVSKAKKFLEQGNKVKVSIRFKGRQITHTQLAHEPMNRFAEEVSEFGVVEKPSKMEGRSMLMILAPKTGK